MKHVSMNGSVHNGTIGAGVVDLDLTRSDEELMGQLASGRQEALGPLYGRYAALFFNVAAQSLDHAAAEEVVQDVYLSIWRTAGAFDPAQGAFRPWALRLLQWKVVNELRRRRRRPLESRDPEEEAIGQLADAAPGPDDRAWQAERSQVVRAALDALPPKQREALALAFLDDLSHEQVATRLGVPLGTAKTRIRDGMLRLRPVLAPFAAALLLLVSAGAGIFRMVAQQQTLDRSQRAVAILTSSETETKRVEGVAGAPDGMHGNYRMRLGSPVAVLSLSHAPAPPTGLTYQGWARFDDRWLSLGTVRPDANGEAVLIAAGPELAARPDAIEVTMEPADGSASPGSQLMLAWPAP